MLINGWFAFFFFRGRFLPGRRLTRFSALLYEKLSYRLVSQALCGVQRSAAVDVGGIHIDSQLHGQLGAFECQSFALAAVKRSTM